MRLYTSFHLFAGLGLLDFQRARRLMHKLPATMMLAQLGSAFEMFFARRPHD